MVFQSLTLPGQEVAEDTRGLGFDNRTRLLEPGWPKMAFIEDRFANDPTNWWVPNHACIEALLRSSGLQVTKALGQEMYLCAPDPQQSGLAQLYDTTELAAATGLNISSDTAARLATRLGSNHAPQGE